LVLVGFRNDAGVVAGGLQVRELLVDAVVVDAGDAVEKADNGIAPEPLVAG
jgi:hypothetical protein